MAALTTINQKSGNSTHATTTYNTSKTQDTVVHTLTDDGAGTFGPLGTISYSGKSLNVRFLQMDAKTEGYKSDHEKATEFEGSIAGTGVPATGSDSAKGGDYQDAAVAEQILAASTVTVSYATGFASATSHTYSYSPPTVSIDLCPYTADYILPGSVMFTWMGQVYIDQDGVLYRGRVGNDPGFVAGQLDYSAGLAIIYDYIVSGSPSNFVLNSLFTVRQMWTTASIFMRTQAAPVKPTGFVMNLSDAQGLAITATGDLNGNIIGTHLRGKMDYETGVVELQFGDFVLDTTLTPAQKLEWWYSAADIGAVQVGKIWRPWPVDPTTLRYNSVSYFYLPLDADLLGIDPVRLPQDGRVSIFQPGFRAVIGNTKKIIGITAVNGNTVNCARTRLSRIRVIGANGNTINIGYTANLEAGTLTFVNVTGYSQPVTVEHRIEDMVVLTDVGIDGTLKSNRQITHDYPVLDTYVSSALMTGDLYGRVSILFSQSTWTGVWSDAVIGTEPTGKYNDLAAPIVVTNAGAMTQRWALRFQSSGTFDVVGENVGVVASNVSINVDCAPINPITGQPYFTVRALGWGGGWAAGNVVRLNTIGAIYTYNVIRTVQAGPESGTDYSFTLLQRGDVDRP